MQWTDRFGPAYGTGKLVSVKNPSLVVLVGEGIFPAFRADSVGQWRRGPMGSVAGTPAQRHYRGHKKLANGNMSGINLLLCDGHVEFAKVPYGGFGTATYDPQPGFRCQPNPSWESKDLCGPKKFW